jgi:dephospho-CoA kinase
MSETEPPSHRGAPPLFRAGHKPVVGLVGGIGSGKSQVAALLARHGARVVSGDELAHQALRQPEVRDRVVRRWGAHLLDDHGQVERRRLAAIVFADPAERRALEAMAHPWIKAGIRAEVEAARADESVRFVVLDAAVMLEAGWHDVCDTLVFVDAPPEVRARRVADQRRWSARDLGAREAAQLPLTDKRACADHVLDNSASLEHLSRQVGGLLALWGLAPAPPGGPEPGCSPGASHER